MNWVKRKSTTYNSPIWVKPIPCDYSHQCEVDKCPSDSFIYPEKFKVFFFLLSSLRWGWADISMSSYRG